MIGPLRLRDTPTGTKSGRRAGGFRQFSYSTRKRATVVFAARHKKNSRDFFFPVAACHWLNKSRANPRASSSSWAINSHAMNVTLFQIAVVATELTG